MEFGFFTVSLLIKIRILQFGTSIFLISGIVKELGTLFPRFNQLSKQMLI